MEDDMRHRWAVRRREDNAKLEQVRAEVRAKAEARRRAKAMSETQLKARLAAMQTKVNTYRSGTLTQGYASRLRAMG